jgi:hypothetical protein
VSVACWLQQVYPKAQTLFIRAQFVVWRVDARYDRPPKTI